MQQIDGKINRDTDTSIREGQVRHTQFVVYKYYGCSFFSRRGTAVCLNRTLLPQATVEAELLEILQQQLLTPATLDRVLTAVNAMLRAQAAASRPRVKELRRTLTQVEREIANYRRAVARGDFRSLEAALMTAEQRQAALQAELIRLDGTQPSAFVQITPAALERHLQGLTEKLRSGAHGKVREVIQRAISRIMVDVDGSLTVEAKPGGLLGLEGNLAHLDYQEGRSLLEHHIVSQGGRQWRVISADQESSL